MSSKKYSKADVVKPEATLSNKDMRINTSHYTIPTNYHPSEDVSNELNARRVQLYQKLIGKIQWAVKIVRVDIILEVSILS